MERISNIYIMLREILKNSIKFDGKSKNSLLQTEQNLEKHASLVENGVPTFYVYPE